jgi:aldose 1-epimerase
MRGIAPSGEQLELTLGRQRATIVEVGGGIREYRVEDRPVLDPYDLAAICDGAHGTPLIPWPNRLRDGRYSFDGTDYQVALSEPERHNAIHGFLRWRPWRASEHDGDRVVMSARLHPLAGYPFALDLRIEYGLSEDGLTVTTTATNIGDRSAPYGCGQHPYLSAGGGLIDDCTLEVAAQARIVTDPQRMLPCGTAPVAGSSYDYRTPARLGDQTLDLAFSDLGRDADGLAHTRLSAPDGTCVELWADEHYRFLELYTGDALADERRRRGLGVEPMTCAPDAFRSGDGLVHLQPGERMVTRWGVRLR